MPAVEVDEEVVTAGSDFCILLFPKTAETNVSTPPFSSNEEESSGEHDGKDVLALPLPLEDVDVTPSGLPGVGAKLPVVTALGLVEPADEILSLFPAFELLFRLLLIVWCILVLLLAACASRLVSAILGTTATPAPLPCSGRGGRWSTFLTCEPVI